MSDEQPSGGQKATDEGSDGRASGTETAGSSDGDAAEITIEFDDADRIVADSADEFVEAVALLAASDPIKAGDQIGELVRVAREFEDDRRRAASETVHLIGTLRPQEFEVWSDRFLELAESPDDDLALLGLRSLAQLAGENPRAAAPALDVALAELNGEHDGIRRAAFALVAEVGETDPTAVRRADREIAAALDDPARAARLGAAIAAGRLLAADPTHFPRTAGALYEALEDDDETVREYAHVALAHYARSNPAHVDTDRAIDALLGVTDREIGLEEGQIAGVIRELLDPGDG